MALVQKEGQIKLEVDKENFLQQNSNVVKKYFFADTNYLVKMLDVYTKKQTKKICLVIGPQLSDTFTGRMVIRFRRRLLGETLGVCYDTENG